MNKLPDPGLVRVDTFRTADTGIERFYRNFIFFLALVGIFTLLLAGIGIQSSLTAFLRERYSTIAIAKTVGATSRFVTANFYLVVLLLGGIGALAGMVLGFALQWVLPSLLGGLLPPDVELVIAPRAVFESLLLGLAVVLVFTFLPLFRLEELRPGFIFRKEEPPITRWLPYAITVAVIVALFTGLVIWQLGQVRTGLYFAGGSIALLLIAGALTEVALRLLRPLNLRSLVQRQALRGLFRPRNSTRAIVITLSAALGVLFAIFLIEQNLRASFVQSYPPDAPNVFFLDIQPDQLDAFRSALGMEADYVPTVRAALEAVNGQPPAFNPEEGPAGGGNGNGDGSSRGSEQDNGGSDNQRRTPQYTLSYRDRLQEGESIVAGPGLFDSSDPGPQVSVLKETMDRRGLHLGDRLTFNVQGVPIEATVRSVRAQNSDSVQPFFSFVFQPQVLADAPQTLFTGIRVPQGEIAATAESHGGAVPQCHGDRRHGHHRRVCRRGRPHHAGRALLCPVQHPGRAAHRRQLGLRDPAGAGAGGCLLQGARGDEPFCPARLCPRKRLSGVDQRPAGSAHGAGRGLADHEVPVRTGLPALPDPQRAAGGPHRAGRDGGRHGRLARHFAQPPHSISAPAG